jgi:hypothetical protein
MTGSMVCSIMGCNRWAERGSLCALHYDRMINGVALHVDPASHLIGLKFATGFSGQRSTAAPNAVAWPLK